MNALHLRSTISTMARKIDVYFSVIFLISGARTDQRTRAVLHRLSQGKGGKIRSKELYFIL